MQRTNLAHIEHIIAAKNVPSPTIDLHTIGEFALLANVSVKSLRYYEKIGLLKPESVNADTGYRYYSLEQLSRLNRIIALKNLGLSLGEIAQLLADNLSPSELRGMLRLKQAQLQDKIQDEQRRLAEVEARLQMIESGQTLPKFEIAIKSVSTQLVMTSPKIRTGQGRKSYMPLFEDLAQKLDHLGIERGHAMGMYYPFEHDDHWMTANIGKGFFGEIEPWWYQAGYVVDEDCPQQLEAEDGTRLTQIELPISKTVASITHHGALGSRRELYYNFIDWVGINDYRIGLPCYEIYLRVREQPNNPTNIVEVQIPIAM